MKLHQLRKGDSLVWRYGQLRIIARTGETKRDLSELEKIFPDHDMEFAPVKQFGMYADTLAGFSFNPLADFHISSKVVDGKTAGVFYTFRETECLNLIDAIFQRAEIKEASPNGEVITRLQGDVVATGLVNYSRTKAVATSLRVPIERVFVARAYAAFLHNYHEIGAEGSRKVASEKFGVDLSR